MLCQGRKSIGSSLVFMKAPSLLYFPLPRVHSYEGRLVDRMDGCMHGWMDAYWWGTPPDAKYVVGLDIVKEVAFKAPWFIFLVFLVYFFGRPHAQRTGSDLKRLASPISGAAGNFRESAGPASGRFFSPLAEWRLFIGEVGFSTRLSPPAVLGCALGTKGGWGGGGGAGGWWRYIF